MKRFLNIALSAFALVAISAGTASAHITANADTTDAGSYSYVRFGVPHGCGEKGTTSFTIKVPQEDYVFTAVTPFENPQWNLSVKQGPLKEAQELHGEKQTEGVHEVTYTRKGAPLDAHRGDAVHLSIRLPEDAAGDTLYFPVVQRCEGGEEHGWIQVPQEGENPHDLESPAPAIEVTGAGGGHGGADSAKADEMADAELASTKAEATDLTRVYALSGLALLLGAIGIVLPLLRGRGGASKE